MPGREEGRFEGLTTVRTMRPGTVQVARLRLNPGAAIETTSRRGGSTGSTWSVRALLVPPGAVTETGVAPRRGRSGSVKATCVGLTVIEGPERTVAPTVALETAPRSLPVRVIVGIGVARSWTEGGVTDVRFGIGGGPDPM